MFCLATGTAARPPGAAGPPGAADAIEATAALLVARAIAGAVRAGQS
jgi:hypothetical protein